MEKWKYKVIYMTFLFSLCAGLVGIAYLAFLQTVDIDMMLGIKLEYTGPSGRATVTASSKTDDINKRIKGLMETVTYTIEPDMDLSNGDIITVKAHYDEQYAADYHFNPVNTTKDFLVQGLDERYVRLADVPADFLEEARDAARSYLQEYLEPDTQLQPVYAAFLRADHSTNSDRLLWMYECTTVQGKRMWYMVLVPDINTSKKIAAARIFAERAYLEEAEVADHDYAGYVRKVFDTDYQIEEIDVQEDK